MSAREEGPAAVPAEVTLTAIRELLELGRSLSPLVAEPDADNWWSASAGLFMRTLTIAETTVHVCELGRPADLTILVRCLYEHAVMLAWVAAPRDDSRWTIWNRESLRLARAWGNEMAGLGAGELEEDVQDWLQEKLAKPIEPLPRVPELAKQADADWRDRLGLKGMNTLEASYTNVYRGGSWHAHPSAAGLFGVRQPAGEHVVFALEPRSDISAVVGPAFTALAVALVVATHTFGRPHHDAIRAVVEDLARAAAQAG